MLVISLGLMLVGGTLLLAVGLWHKSFDMAETAAACPGGRVDLKGRGAIVETAVDGGNLRVTLEKKGGGVEIVTIDLCNGKVAGSLTLESDRR